MKPYQSYKGGYVRLNPELYIEFIDFEMEKIVQKENGELTSYYYNEAQKEFLANVINSRIEQYFKTNFDKILAEAKEYVGEGLIV